MTALLPRLAAAFVVAAPLALALPVSAQESDTTESGPAIIPLVPDTAAPDAEVKVIRGSAVRPDPVVRVYSSKVITEAALGNTSGDTLWLVDRKAREVTGCYLSATIVAGATQDIRCTTRRLP